MIDQVHLSEESMKTFLERTYIKSQYTYIRDNQKIQNQRNDRSSSFMLRIHKNILNMNLHQVPVYILRVNLKIEKQRL